MFGWGLSIDNEGKRVIKNLDTGEPVCWVCPSQEDLERFNKLATQGEVPILDRDCIGEGIILALNTMDGR